MANKAKSRFAVQKQKLMLFAACLILSLILALAFAAIIWQTLQDLPIGISENSWNLNSIEKALGVSIPQNASDVRFSGENGRLVRLDLTFKAPPITMSDFTNHICGGVLYPHYDPLNAIHVGESVTYTYAVKLLTAYNSSDYTYSPNASQNIYGNRCFGKTISQIFYTLVDKTNSSLYSLTLKFYPACGPAPCMYEFLDIKPISQFPLLLRGLHLEGKAHNYYLHPGKLCMEIDPLVFVEPDNEWRDLPGSEVQFSIGDQLLNPAYISDNGVLTTRELEATSNVNNQYFSYCYSENWQPGSHTLKMHVTTSSGKSYTYSWVFYTSGSLS